MQRARAEWKPEPLMPSSLVAYLGSYGFFSSDAGNWSKAENDISQLDLDVLSHHEEDGHTYYTILCRLRGLEGDGWTLEWEPKRRLAQLRDSLHDPVKESLGGLYDHYFAAARFALRGGLPGTTDRLQAWCRVLANCISNCLVSPGTVATTLLFLQPPAASASVSKRCRGSRRIFSASAAEDLGGAMPPAATPVIALLPVVALLGLPVHAAFLPGGEAASEIVVEPATPTLPSTAASSHEVGGFVAGLAAMRGADGTASGKASSRAAGETSYHFSSEVPRNSSSSSDPSARATCEANGDAFGEALGKVPSETNNETFDKALGGVPFENFAQFSRETRGAEFLDGFSENDGRTSECALHIRDLPQCDQGVRSTCKKSL